MPNVGESGSHRSARTAQDLSDQPSPRTVWRLALVGPLLTAALAFIWWGVTPQRCVGIGQTVVGGAPWVGWALQLLGPLATALYARHRSRWTLRGIGAILVSLATAVVFGWLAWQWWWGSHGCYL